mmetsp:Transcript_17415/g.29755  ORF Transcript_17415/g.29755 Transcript_17415/m.29755 type:complete len:222 (+) Transcript_17415:508-1173(+)
MREELGVLIDGASTWLDKNHSYVRTTGVLAMVAGTYYLCSRTRFGMQIRNIDMISIADFSKKRRLRGYLEKWENKNGCVHLEMVHRPPCSWLFGINWPFVQRSKTLPLRLCGVAFKDKFMTEPVDMIVNSNKSVTVECLYLDKLNGDVVCRVNTGFLRRKDLGASLIKLGECTFYSDESPGLHASPSLEAIRSMDSYLVLLHKLSEPPNPNPSILSKLFNR